jgi:hypothetical protein
MGYRCPHCDWEDPAGPDRGFHRSEMLLTRRGEHKGRAGTLNAGIEPRSMLGIRTL